ncbi:MerR family transcriptional regulator [Bifidobacterium callimiconis]|uniref:Transcriptional regulator, MerR family n=1 Tax=Bifidobacterium callimiconis TaxID=2306973 RepID=A0A430FFN9_9BIFI|nr:MerR family transcriptional regulator [Bifidobacterium callimiconis]RSX51656.1 Transcriptional regulator, MerR family [Bifidobacterium callimiconis]
MSATTTWHTIREASLISGLPESTLRYYEQVGIIPPIARDPSSGHRAYSDADLERLTTISCLSSTGMPLDAMREYLANAAEGAEGARRQMELLDAQALRLAARAEVIRMQQAYVSFKTLYWRAVAEGRADDARRLLEENSDIVDKVKHLQSDGKVTGGVGR